MDTGANIYVCLDTTLFSSYSGGELISCTCSWYWYDHSEVYFEKEDVTEEYAPCLLYKKKNLVSNSITCRDCYKIIFESKKYVPSKHVTLVDKGYNCWGYFCLSLHDNVFNKVVTNVVVGILNMGYPLLLGQDEIPMAAHSHEITKSIAQLWVKVHHMKPRAS